MSKPVRTLRVVNVSATRIGCACKKSKCLKMYCEYFAGQFLCSVQTCKCLSCSNRHKDDERRRQAISVARTKDVLIFEKHLQSRTKIIGDMVVTKSNGRISCRYKRSRCVMKYCDYFLSALTAVSPAAVVDVEILSDWL